MHFINLPRSTKHTRSWICSFLDVDLVRMINVITVPQLFTLLMRRTLNSICNSRRPHVNQSNPCRLLNQDSGRQRHPKCRRTTFSSLDKFMIIVNLYPLLQNLLNFFFRFWNVLYWIPRKLFPVFCPSRCLCGCSEECIWQFTWCLWWQNRKLQEKMSWPTKFKEHIEK